MVDKKKKEKRKRKAKISTGGQRRGTLRRTAPDLTLGFRRLLVVAGDVGLERVAAAVERVVAVLVVQDAGKADLPLIAVAAQLRVQAQTAAVQVLQARVEPVRNQDSGVRG